MLDLPYSWWDLDPEERGFFKIPLPAVSSSIKTVIRMTVFRCRVLAKVMAKIYDNQFYAWRRNEKWWIYVYLGVPDETPNIIEQIIMAVYSIFQLIVNSSYLATNIIMMVSLTRRNIFRTISPKICLVDSFLWFFSFLFLLFFLDVEYNVPQLDYVCSAFMGANFMDATR